MRTRTAFIVVAALLAAFAITGTSHAQMLVSIDTVTVSNPGNPADSTGYGAVGYEFAIGKHEVSLSEYATFLNSVAATDTYNLYNTSMASHAPVAGISRSGLSGSYNYNLIAPSGITPSGASSPGKRPVAYVSWFDAARFANWMHNGATNGASTETGAYSLNGATNGIIAKNAGAKWWIPSEDEWYKAAYYDPERTGANGYWLYPTRSDSAPGNLIGSGVNQANSADGGVFSVSQSASYDIAGQNYLTDGGAYSSSASYSGTYDQGGNLWELNDTVVVTLEGLQYVRRGGSFFSFDSSSLQSTTRTTISPTGEADVIGFRLATVPEPSTYALLLMTGAGALWFARRRR